MKEIQSKLKGRECREYESNENAKQALEDLKKEGHSKVVLKFGESKVRFIHKE